MNTPATNAVPHWGPLPEADEADYCFDANNWDCTHTREDIGELLDDLPCGEVMEIGRLKKLPNKFVAQVYVEQEDEYETRFFDTEADALKAIAECRKG